MTTVDLITGFLGAGKTTFIKKYARFLKASGQRFAVIENEFGVAGVDTAVLKNDGLFVEELSGGCICCSLKVNFHDMLLELSKSYDRIIVEPSGIFSPEDFFEIMRSPKVKKACCIGCVLAVLDPMSLLHEMSDEDEIVMAGEILSCSRIIISKTETLCPEERGEISAQLEELLYRHAPKYVSEAAPKIYDATLTGLNKFDFVYLENLGHGSAAKFLKSVDHTALFQSCTIYPSGIFEKEFLEQSLEGISACGEVSRVKGYVSGENGSWLVNYTSGGSTVEPAKGDMRPMLNIIGRGLNRRKLGELFNRT